MEGVGERPFQAEGAAGARATQQTGTGMFRNRKPGLGRGGGVVSRAESGQVGPWRTG